MKRATAVIAEPSVILLTCYEWPVAGLLRIEMISKCPCHSIDQDCCNPAPNTGIASANGHLALQRNTPRTDSHLQYINYIQFLAGTSADTCLNGDWLRSAPWAK